MAESLSKLSGLPLAKVAEALGAAGLAVEGSYGMDGNGRPVTYVSMTGPHGEVVRQPVKPVVVWNGVGTEPITLFYPTRR